MSKKLHAKDLKKDEFVETLGGIWGPVFHWIQTNRGLLIAGMGGLLILVLAVGAIGSARESSARAGQAALGEALFLLSRAEAKAADPSLAGPSWAEVQTAFQAVSDDQGGGTGALAKHYVGLTQLRTGDAASAIVTLTAVATAKTSDWQTRLTRSLLAAAEEQAGDAAAAEATLKSLRDESGLGYPADAATMDLARFYERQGRLEEARSLYAEVAPPEREDESEAEEDAELPSVYAGQAKARLGELKS